MTRIVLHITLDVSDDPRWHQKTVVKVVRDVATTEQVVSVSESLLDSFGNEGPRTPVAFCSCGVR